MSAIEQARQNLMTFRVDINHDQYNNIEAGRRFGDDQHQKNADYYTGMVQSELQTMHNDFHLIDSAYQIAIGDAMDAGDMALVNKLKGEQRELRSAYNSIVNRPPGLGNSSSEFARKWEAKLDRLADAVSTGFASLGGVQDPVHFDPQLPAATAPVAAGATVGAGGSTAGVEGGGQESGWVELPKERLDQMMRDITSDPEAFMSAMKSITDPEQRSFVMQQLQMRLQEINQMFSMMANFSKAMHDTNKAIINNFRV